MAASQPRYNRGISYLAPLVALVAIIVAAGAAYHHGFSARHANHCIAPIPGQLIAAPISLLPAGTRVLVTGAAGFIGSHVATYLHEQLHLTVIAVDDLSGGFIENLHTDEITLVIGDLKNESFVDMIFDQYGPFDSIYHLAAYAAEGMSHFIRSFNYRNNLVASVYLLNQAVLNEVHTFVFTSSIAAYGDIPPPMKETDIPHPVDPYGIAKYGMELDLQAAHEMFNMTYIIFRPHNVYGIKQNIIDKYRNVIGIFFSQIMRGEPLTIFGDGQQTRAFTYIDDVAPMIASAPYIEGAKNQIFNIGSDEPHSLLTLATLISEAMNVSYNVQHLPARHEVIHANSNHDHLRCIFGIGSSISLIDGIYRVANWIKDRGGHESFVPVEFDHVEVMKNMPPNWITSSMTRYEEERRNRRRTRMRYNNSTTQ